MKHFYITYVASINGEVTFKNLVIEEPFNILDIKNQAKDECDVEDFESFMVLGVTEFSSAESIGKFFCHPIPPADKK